MQEREKSCLRDQTRSLNQMRIRHVILLTTVFQTHVHRALKLEPLEEILHMLTLNWR